MKKLISSLLAAAALLTTSISAQAEMVTADMSDGMVDINGYACYEKDGQFYTMLDGDECLVINVDEIFAEAVANGLSVQSITSGDPPEDWTNDQFNLVIPETMYTYTCDISNGDYCSPVHQMVYNHENFEILIETGQWTSNTYDVELWLHTLKYDNWFCSKSLKITFSLLNARRALLIGSVAPSIDGYAIKFLELPESSTAERNFQYALGYGNAV